MNWKMICAALLTAGGMTAAGAKTSEIGEGLNLRGREEGTLHFLFENSKGDNAGALKNEGKNWTPVQLNLNGFQIQFKKSKAQYLIGAVAMKNQSFSISVWIAADSVSTPYAAVLLNTTTPPCWGIRLSPTKGSADSMLVDLFFNFAIKDVPGGYLAGTSALKVKDWHLVAASFDRNNERLTFYIDGKKAGSAKLPKETAVFKDYISIGGPGWLFDGKIRYLRFYPGVLSAGQMEKIYSQEQNFTREKN